MPRNNQSISWKKMAMSRRTAMLLAPTAPFDQKNCFRLLILNVSRETLFSNTKFSKNLGQQIRFYIFTEYFTKRVHRFLNVNACKLRFFSSP